jgi:hypothetical protein
MESTLLESKLKRFQKYILEKKFAPLHVLLWFTVHFGALSFFLEFGALDEKMGIQAIHLSSLS